MATVSTLEKRQYRDFSLVFSKNPVTHDIVTVTDTEAVKRAIKNLLLTQCGEMPFFPSFGSQLHRLLFEPIDPITSARIESDIRATLKSFEPRCQIGTLVITPTPDEQQYRVDMEIQLLNLVTPVTMTVFLQRVR